MTIERRDYARGTSLVQSYPWGLYHGGRAMCSDGRVRALKRIAITADTFFSVPAAVTVAGRTVSGYVTVECASGSSVVTDDDPAVVKFVAVQYGRNHDALPDGTWTNHAEQVLAEHGDAGGPGKFEGNAYPAAASYVHSLTLDGQTVEQCGDVQWGGWYGLIYLSAEQRDDITTLGWERDADAAPESLPVAAIVAEDGQGFVDVTFYDSEDAAQASMAEVAGQVDADEDEEE